MIQKYKRYSPQCGLEDITHYLPVCDMYNEIFKQNVYFFGITHKIGNVYSQIPGEKL